MEKIFKIALVFTFIVFLYGCDEVRQESEPFTYVTNSSWLTCSTDEDCTVVLVDCCDCNNGGAYTAINKAYVEAYEAEHSCDDIACSAVISDDLSCFGVVQPRCLENKCGYDLHDISLCDQLVDTLEYSVCYEQLAFYNQDASYCSYIDDKEEKESCILKIAEQTQDISLCASLSTENEPKCADRVYFATALETNDSAVCYEILTDNKKNECLMKIARDTENFALCDEINDTASKEECIGYVYYWKAEREMDGTFCLEITDISMKNRCLWDMAMLIEDSELCAVIVEDERVKGWCYSYFGDDDQ